MLCDVCDARVELTAAFEGLVMLGEQLWRELALVKKNKNTFSVLFRRAEPPAAAPTEFRTRAGGSADYYRLPPAPTARGRAALVAGGKQDGGGTNALAAHIGALHNDLLQQWVARVVASCSVEPAREAAAAVDDEGAAVASRYIAETMGFHVMERQCRNLVKEAITEIVQGVKLWTRHDLSC